jgi:hypothetical protein
MLLMVLAVGAVREGAPQTLTNGAARSGSIPDEASFGKQTFEVLSSRLQPGCAESAIVDGILGLIDRSRQ